MTKRELNWAGNLVYGAAAIHRPLSVAEIQEIVSKSSKVKALGSRHSFNSIADTTGDLVSFEHLDRVIELDKGRSVVTVEAGIRYGDLAVYLNQQGYALHNLASLPHISVAGACTTATHGSGDRNGNLSTAIRGIEFVAGDGNLVRLSKDVDRERFAGAVVGLGGVGLVTSLTLEVAPTFSMTQEVYEALPLSALDRHFDEITSAGYSVSLFTTWQEDVIDQVWVKKKAEIDDPGDSLEELFGAKLADGPRHPLPGCDTVNCTEQMKVPGAWHERMPHFRMNFTPSSGEELQSEYLIPRQFAVEAIHAVYEMRDRIVADLQVSEIRTVAADELWMSPCYRQPCVGIHFTWKKDWERVKLLLPLIEAKLAKFEARAHWGKLFVHSPVSRLYPRLGEFRGLAEQYGPSGKFRNAFLDRHVFL